MYTLGQKSSARAEHERKTPAAAVASAPSSSSAASAALESSKSPLPSGPAPLVMETPTSRPSEAPAMLLSAVQTTPVAKISSATTAPAAGAQVGPSSADSSSVGGLSASAKHVETPPNHLPNIAQNSHVSNAPTTAPAALASMTLSAQPLVDAKARIDAGDLLAARDILEAALQSGKLSPADVHADKLMLNQVNDVVVFSSRRFPQDQFGGSMTVPPGGVLARIASSHDVTPELLMRMNGITNPRRLRAGQTLKIVSGPFNAIVYKRAFTLEIWLGEPNGKASQYITSFPVGLGKDDSTPTGTWAIENKLKNPAYYSPRGQGVVEADDPKNPLGEYWLGLTGTDGQAVGKESYGIHGTIDPSSIGKQDSMGCIRLTNENVERVYELLVQGKSTVTVAE
jgi:LysM repeat protein